MPPQGLSDGTVTPTGRRKDVQRDITDVRNSKFADVLLNSNPLHTKQLESELELLDSKKRTRALHHFLEQRQFFIKRLFDGDNNLRFAKAKLKKHPAPATGASRDTLMSGTGSDMRRSQTACTTIPETSDKTARPIVPLRANISKNGTPLTDRLFLDHTNNLSGLNRNKIMAAQQRLYAHRQSLRDKGQGRAITAPVRRSNDRPVTPIGDQVTDNQCRVRTSTRSAWIGTSPQQTLRPHTPVAKSKLKVCSLTMSNLKAHTISSKEVGDFAAELLERFLYDTKDLCKARNVGMCGMANSPRNEPDLDPSQKQLAQRQEKLVRKIAMSLPVHLLKQTEEQATSLPEVLGHSEYKKALLSKEHQYSQCLTQDGDGRFRTLMSSLAKA